MYRFSKIAVMVIALIVMSWLWYNTGRYEVVIGGQGGCVRLDKNTGDTWRIYGGAEHHVEKAE